MDNGVATGNGTVFNSVVTVSCEDGYTLNGDYVLQCLDGGWNGSASCTIIGESCWYFCIHFTQSSWKIEANFYINSIIPCCLKLGKSLASMDMLGTFFFSHELVMYSLTLFCIF